MHHHAEKIHGRRRGRAALTIGIFIAAAACSNADWPQFRGPDRDGKAADSGLLRTWPEGGPQQVWSYDQLGIGYSSAAVTSDGIYITGMENGQGFIYALTLDGELRWKTPYGPEWEKSYSGARTTPTLHDGKLYIMSGYGQAACFDARSGREIWSVDTAAQFGARNIKWGITESPLVLDGKVIFSPGGPQAGVVALHPDTGATVWVSRGVNDTSGYCSPIVVERGGRQIIVQLMATTFLGIGADDGALLWRVVRDPVPRHNIQAVSPVYADGLFYITSGYGGERGAMFRLSADGTQVTAGWRDAELDCHHGGIVLLDGHIYGAADRNNRNQWLCMNLATGAVTAKIQGVGKGSVVFADGMLYTLSERGMMGLVDPNPANFRMVSSFQVPSGGQGPHWAHPSIAGGRLYVRHAGTLFVYRISAP